MQEEKENVRELDLVDLLGRFWKYLRRFWILVLAAALLCSGLFFLRAKGSFTPVYEAKAMFTVSASNISEDIFTTSYYDNTAAQQLASAFPYMLSTDIMRELMMQELGVSYINGSIYPESASGTNLFTLRVRSTSAQDAYDILCAVIECYPQVAVYMVDNPRLDIRQNPEVPSDPVNSFSGQDAAVKGAVAGLVLSMGLLVVLTLLDRTISNVEQLKNIVNLPILAVFPKVRKKKRRSGAEPLIGPSSSQSLAESLRGLRLKVHKALAEEEDPKVILVTSTLSGEGKTTVAANLAQSLASEGKSVVLVDADLRSQTVAARFGQRPGQYGLLDCLKDPQIHATECLSGLPKSSLMYISGRSVRDRHYSIDPKSMRRVLDELSAEFEYIILDTAPCAVVADTALLCHYAKCVLYVVKPEIPRESQLLDAVNGLYERGVMIAGFVVNGVEHNLGSYGYRYGYGYKYGYGYSSKKSGSGTRK